MFHSFAGCDAALSIQTVLRAGLLVKYVVYVYVLWNLSANAIYFCDIVIPQEYIIWL